MTDRPNPEGPERDPAAARPSESEPNETALNEPIPLGSPPPEPLHSDPPDTGPVPEPSPHRAPVEPEPGTTVDPVAEPAAPAQVAPEPGAAPIPFEPEPSVPEPVSPESDAPVSPSPESARTLALPPTTREVEPTPVPSAPPRPTGVPVPFAAPPTERSRYFGMRLGLGIGGGALLIGGIVFAVIAAFIVFGNSVTGKIEDTAAEFIAAIAEDDWDAAYTMLCEDFRDRPVEEYVSEWDAWDAEGAEVQPMSATDTEVRVEFADGTAIDLLIQIDQSAEALDTSVCGWSSANG